MSQNKSTCVVTSWVCTKLEIDVCVVGPKSRKVRKIYFQSSEFYVSNRFSEDTFILYIITIGGSRKFKNTRRFLGKDCGTKQE